MWPIMPVMLSSHSIYYALRKSKYLVIIMFCSGTRWIWFATFRLVVTYLHYLQTHCLLFLVLPVDLCTRITICKCTSGILIRKVLFARVGRPEVLTRYPETVKGYPLLGISCAIIRTIAAKLTACVKLQETIIFLLMIS